LATIAPYHTIAGYSVATVPPLRTYTFRRVVDHFSYPVRARAILNRNLIQHFLYQRHYSGTYIREYVRSGLLALITARSFRSFFDLGDAIRQLAYDYP
jgi:hypothetical protein